MFRLSCYYFETGDSQSIVRPYPYSVRISHAPLPHQKLRELIVQYGRCLCDDPRRCEALLKDYCGQHKREIFVLVSALKSRVAEDLINASAGVPPALLLGRLIKRLEDELALSENAGIG